MAEAAFRVTGRVQGVGFRWWTRSQAVRLGLTGRVRNASDGSVEVIARGEQSALDDLRRLLASGPPGAEVHRVDPLSATHAPDDGFHIER